MKKFTLFLTGIFIYSIGFNQTIINPFFWGNNYWEPSNFPGVWPAVKASGCKILRRGGIEPNVTDPIKIEKLIEFIDESRARNIEPVVQIPYQPQEVNSLWPKKKNYWIAQARAAVYEINVVQKKNVRFFQLANESNQAVPNGYGFTTAQQFADMIKPLATAMKDADPNILIIATDNSYFDASLYSDLLSDPDMNTHSIAGKIISGKGAGKFFVDRISFHMYESSAITSQDEIIERPSKSLAANKLNGLYGYFANCGRTVNDLKIAITETNLQVNQETPTVLVAAGTSCHARAQASPGRISSRN